jgi:tight adherence protein B
MTMQVLALVFLAAVACGGLAWVFLHPILSGERTTEKRIVSVAKAEPARKPTAPAAQRARREQVEETLKEFEVRRKQINRPTLALRLERAGLSWTKRQFMLASGAFGLAVFFVVSLAGAGLMVGAALGFAAGAGLPMWVLTFLRKRRENRFLNAFPDAVDVIVRGVKAGLPLHDSLRAIVNDSPEPIRSEFRTIVETQSIGMPLGEACGKLYERMALAEANFFAIVIAIQQQAGGNLSEALGNLSRVLRDRKRMKEKIKAMSMEAKASAVIIGSLPIMVMSTVYITSPNYISLLWIDPMGRMMLAVCGIWMAIGVFVMKKMINFDF